VEILARAFYALHDTKTPVLIGIGAMSLNVIFSFTFSAAFKSWGLMPHGGLALANTVATGLEMIGLILIMRIRLHGLNGKQIWTGVLKASLAGGIMAGSIWGWLLLTGHFSYWVVGLGGVFTGLVVYTVALGVFRTKELSQLTQAVQKRLIWK